MHKYGLELLLWTDNFTKDRLDLIPHAKELGFDGVEILINHPDEFPIEETKRTLEEHDMGINFAVVLDKDTNSISPDEDVRKNALKFMKKCIDVAYGVSGGGCGIGGVNYVAWGYLTGNQRTEQEWEWAVSYYREAAKYAQDKNITLAIEPVNRFETFFINVASDAVQFCKDVGEPNAKVHLDTYHMIREEKDFYKAIVETGDYLGYFHACENERGIPGTGLVDWEDVYRGLKDINYKGWITIESFTPDMKELARLTAIWRKHAPSADDLAKEGLKNLKEIEKRIIGD
ncbi:MAG: sugar phosphate isomerase/epimerase [Spirochaetes bacterium]|nr:MAG: sugar phosphate isomerase/epimerase [Spirochaetota bacterium]